MFTHCVWGLNTVVCLCVISNNAIISLRKKELGAKNFKCVLCVCVLMSHPRSANSMIVTLSGHTYYIREIAHCKIVVRWLWLYFYRTFLFLGHDYNMSKNNENLS